MASSYRPAIDGHDNIIGYDTFSPTGTLVQRFNTEDEAVEFCIAMDTPFKDPRPAAEVEPAPDAEQNTATSTGAPA